MEIKAPKEIGILVLISSIGTIAILTLLMVAITVNKRGDMRQTLILTGIIALFILMTVGVPTLISLFSSISIENNIFQLKYPIKKWSITINMKDVLSIDYYTSFGAKNQTTTYLRFKLKDSNEIKDACISNLMGDTKAFQKFIRKMIADNTAIILGTELGEYMKRKF